jgi:succinyl-diaminopimelate desuccinylase
VGFDITMLPFGTGRDNMVARLGTGDGPPLCFSGHLDTVPLGDAAWSCDPFGGEIRGGRMMGRGTSDMKAGVAAFEMSRNLTMPVTKRRIARQP